MSDERLYAILNQVVAPPTRDNGSGDIRDRETLQVAEIASHETLSPVEWLEIAPHPWVNFVIMPLFAFDNNDVILTLERVDNSLHWPYFSASSWQIAGCVWFQLSSRAYGHCDSTQDLLAFADGCSSVSRYRLCHGVINASLVFDPNSSMLK